MKPTLLTTVYEWACENCGETQIARPMRPEFSDEEIKELAQEHGVAPNEIGEWVCMPETVTCKRCGEKFATQHDDDEDDEG